VISKYDLIAVVIIVVGSPIASLFMVWIISLHYRAVAPEKRLRIHRIMTKLFVALMIATLLAALFPEKVEGDRPMYWLGGFWALSMALAFHWLRPRIKKVPTPLIQLSHSKIAADCA
jgi:hypothetical protein